MEFKPVRLVLDTNILYEGIISGSKIAAYASQGYFEMVASIDMLEEYIEKLNSKKLKDMLRKKYTKEYEIEYQLYMLQFRIKDILDNTSFVAIRPHIKLDVFNDPDDNKFLECAIEGDAEYIITTDKKHMLKVKEYEGIRIMNPKQFMILVCNNFESEDENGSEYETIIDGRTILMPSSKHQTSSYLKYRIKDELIFN